MREKLVLLLLIFNLISFAQEREHKLLGKVVSANGEPLFGATILISDYRFATVANEKGEYIISNIPTGKYIVQASYMGFVTQKKEFDLGGDIGHVDFYLNEDSELLDDVVIIGKTKKTERETRGFATNSVEMKGVKMQSIQATEVLDQSAGVKLRLSGGMGSRVDFNINGLSGNAIKIFIDGVPIENYGSSFSISSIPTEMIERIEVYKGVVPIQFGGDALGGAINVILNKDKINSLNASYSYGSFNTHQIAINGTYLNNKSGFVFRGSGFYNYTDNNYEVWGDQIYVSNKEGDVNYIVAERFHDSYKSKGTKLDFGYTDLSWADELLVGVVLSDMKKDIQHGQTMEIVYGARKGEQNTSLLNTSYKKEDFLTKGLAVNIFGSYSKLIRKSIDTVAFVYDWSGEKVPDYYDISGGEFMEHSSGAEAGSPTLNEDTGKTWVLSNNTSYEINKNNSIQFNFILNDFKQSSDDPLLDPLMREILDTRFVSKNIYGLGYELNAMDKKFRSSLFYKYYHQKIGVEEPEIVDGDTDPVVSRFDKSIQASGYGFAFSYQFTPVFQLMFSGEKALRLPTTDELFGNNLENIDENHDLDPEHSSNLNFGINLGPYNFKKHSLFVKTNFFYRDTKDKIKKNDEVSDSFEYSYYLNEESFLSTGFDTELKYKYNQKLSINIGVSVFNSRFNTEFNEDGEPYIYYQDRERNAPYFTLNVNTDYLFKNFIQKKSETRVYHNLAYVEAFYRGWSAIGGAGKPMIPAQLINSLGIGHTFPNKKLTFSIDARNIFDEQVYDNFALQKPGRAFYAKLSYKFL
ncbi:TonB-dependent receptor [Flavicella sp.]|uniref:TonB-dependent receptor n=1 Tax=Flavicella sp. TaxID=2957742 RepID=UPI003017FA08